LDNKERRSTEELGEVPVDEIDEFEGAHFRRETYVAIQDT